MSFSDLGLTPELLRAVADKGYDTPSPIQLQAIPAVLAGRDVLAGAQTGTGKTAGFVLPILQRLAADVAERHRAPRALVLAPTRELAAQVAQSVRDYGKYLPLRVLQVFGGVGINPQISGLRSGCDILVATPGRLLDLAQQRAADLSASKCWCSTRPTACSTWASFTTSSASSSCCRSEAAEPAVLGHLLRRHSRSRSGCSPIPLSIQVAPRNAPIELVEQRAYRVQKDHKRHLLAHLIREGSWAQVLVFTRTKHGANRLTQQLEGAGIQRRRDPRQQEPGGARARRSTCSSAVSHRARGHRGRGARSRHQGAAARGELRAAERSGGLRASHRPHGPGGIFRASGLAGLTRRAGLAPRHRAGAETQRSGGRDAGIRDLGGGPAESRRGRPAIRIFGSAQRPSAAIRGRMAQAVTPVRGIRRARGSGTPAAGLQATQPLALQELRSLRRAAAACS
jgi:hypothetical protein